MSRTRSRGTRVATPPEDCHGENISYSGMGVCIGTQTKHPPSAPAARILGGAAGGFSPYAFRDISVWAFTALSVYSRVFRGLPGVLRRGLNAGSG